MKPIYIIGAGGLGREVYCLLKDIKEYQVVSFVESGDFESRRVCAGGDTINVIGESRFYELCKRNEMYAIIAIGNSAARERIFLMNKNYCHFPNIIHPSTKITGCIKMGEGNLITHNCFFTDNIILGDCNFFNTGNSIGHDTFIGNFNIFMPNCNISGNVSIQDKNLFGTRSFVLQKLSVGSENTIAPGSSVLRKFENNKTVIGVPAKIVDL